MHNLLLFGDLHLRKGHLQQGEEACYALVAKAKEVSPDIIVLMGDVLHTHEMAHITPFKLLEGLLDDLRKIAPVYVLVGNHDFKSATEDQTGEHFLGPYKKWAKVKVIDRVSEVTLGGHTIVATPYLPYGKFCSSVEEVVEDLDQVDLILTHQPFLVVDPKAEVLPRDYPVVYSGHIHDKCHPQSNLHYIGSSCQENYSEKPDKYACLLEVSKKGVSHRYLRLDIRSIHLEKVRVDELDVKKLVKITQHHEVRLILQGTREEKSDFQSQKENRVLLAAGIKPTWEIDLVDRVVVAPAKRKRKDFGTLLEDLVRESDQKVKDAYNIIYGKEVK